jgi:hypothetical protein
MLVTGKPSKIAGISTIASAVPMPVTWYLLPLGANTKPKFLSCQCA